MYPSELVEFFLSRYQEPLWLSLIHLEMSLLTGVISALSSSRESRTLVQ